MRSLGRVAAVVLALLPAGCAGRRPPSLAPDAPNAIGIYRGRAFDGDRKGPRFRVLLAAVPPDRLHVEILPPVGGPAWILDGGGGRVCLASVEERRAWSGSGDADTVERLLGLRASLADLVAAIVAGASPGDGWTVKRRPAEGGLPERIEIARAGRGIALERRDVRPAKREVGTGAPPSGFRVGPAEEMPGPGLLEGLAEEEGSAR